MFLDIVIVLIYAADKYLCYKQESTVQIWQVKENIKNTIYKRSLGGYKK